MGLNERIQASFGGLILVNEVRRVIKSKQKQENRQIILKAGSKISFINRKQSFSDGGDGLITPRLTRQKIKFEIQRDRNQAIEVDQFYETRQKAKDRMMKRMLKDNTLQMRSIYKVNGKPHGIRSRTIEQILIIQSYDKA